LRLPEDRQAGLVQILFDCLKRWGIVESVMRGVNGSFCARLCKASEISENFFAQKCDTTRRATWRNHCECLSDADFFPAMEKRCIFRCNKIRV